MAASTTATSISALTTIPNPIEELARLLELHKLYNFKAAPEDLIKIDDALSREIASLIAKAGSPTLVEFMHRENLENRVRDDGCIDRQTLGYLRSFRSK